MEHIYIIILVYFTYFLLLLQYIISSIRIYSYTYTHLHLHIYSEAHPSVAVQSRIGHKQILAGKPLRYAIGGFAV